MVEDAYISRRDMFELAWEAQTGQPVATTKRSRTIEGSYSTGMRLREAFFWWNKGFTRAKTEGLK